MRDHEVSTVALLVGFVCFGIGSAVAAFWSQELLQLWSSPDTPRRASERPADRDRTSPGGEQLEPPEPAGPQRPYEEHVRDAPGDGKGRLAPAYRDLPEGCGSLRTKGDDASVTIPPQTSDYRVEVDGDLAAVTLEQTFTNPTESTLDATYQFPLNRRAAVFAMSMRVGDRVVEAEIKKKKNAEKIYDRANRRGKHAALLSQQRPNWFTQKVANIAPGEHVEIELRYVHPLPREEDAYQLVIPTMLGERFRDGGASANDLVAGDGETEALPSRSGRASDWARSETRFPRTSVEVHLDAPVPIREIRSPSHGVRLREYGPSEWWVDPRGDVHEAERHFQLQFELSGDDPRAGINTYWDEQNSRGYFSLLLEPPERPEPQEVSNREIVFVMDTSGSMRGEPLEASKQFVKRAIRGLRRVRDSFRIVRFDNVASGFSERPIQVREASRNNALRYVDQLQSGGGTQYRPAIRRALAPETPRGSLRLVVFLTDGHIGYEFEVLRHLERQLGDARLFGIGVGGHPNRYLLEEMARTGRGFARFLHLEEGAPGADVDERIRRAVRRIRSPVMTHLRIDWGSLDVSGVSPSPPPDLYAGESVRIHGTYSNPGKHTVEVHGTLGAERMTLPITRTFPESSSDGRAVELTWARQRIREKMHELLGAKIRGDTDRSPRHFRREIVDLGLEHSLTTQWTSFVAVADSGENWRSSSPSTGAARRNETPGLGGLGLRGMGRGGGGGKGGGARVLGNLSTRNHGTGASGYGVGAAGRGSSTSTQPQVVAQKPKVTGSLSKEIIRRVVRQHRREVRHCYEKRLEDQPDLEGRVVLHFTVASTGDVVAAHVESETLDDVQLNQCLGEHARKWAFPAVKGGGIVRVRYPYDFSRD